MYLTPNPDAVIAAVMRISQSNKHPEKLWQEAQQNLEKAKESIENSVIKMGHNSPKEFVYAIGYIDGVSRYFLDTIARHRLFSPLVRSQRYTPIKKGYIIPKELEEKPEMKQLYIETCEFMIKKYEEARKKLKAYWRETLNPKDFESEKDFKAKINTSAREDARYLAPISTRTTMWISGNLRTLEYIISTGLVEKTQEYKEIMQQLGKQLKEKAGTIGLHLEPNEYHKHILEMDENMRKIYENKFSKPIEETLEVVGSIDEVVARLVSSALPEKDYGEIKEYFEKAEDSEKKMVLLNYLKGIRQFDKVPRAFEYLDLKGLSMLSFAADNQFVRHRMITATRAEPTLENGIVIPPAFKEAGIEYLFDQVIEKVKETQDIMKKNYVPEEVRNYLLLMATKRKAEFKMNLREVYDFLRLRDNEHAQWEIRKYLAKKIDAKVKEIINSDYTLLGLKRKQK